MKKKSIILAFLALLALVPFMTLLGRGSANDKKSKATACTNPHPERLCTAANTCGAGGTSCELEVRRADQGAGASVKPNVENFSKSDVICIETGASVTWKGGGKNTGIMVDFGDSSPFDEGTISGGSDRPVTLVAKKTGCFKYSVGACTPGSVYGMCGNSDYELIVKAK